MSNACLVDLTICIGCRSCQVACKQWNNLEPEQTRCQGTGGGYENPPALSSRTFTKVSFHEKLNANGDLERTIYTKRQCMHCSDPACVSACPVAALEKTEAGPVIYHPDRCMGCRYCMLACPFNVPTLEWHRLAPTIKKCTFCHDRITDAPPTDIQVNGEALSSDSLWRFQKGHNEPACVKACPTGAIKFGQRDELLAEARQRIAAQRQKRDAPWQYVDHIYGEHEAGGTSWLYISHVPFEEIGFPVNLGEKGYSEYTSLALDSVPAGVIGVGVVMGAVYWITQRRAEIAKTEA